MTHIIDNHEPEKDPIWDLGKTPVTDSIIDASVNLDDYLYSNKTSLGYASSETLSESRERLAKVRESFQGRQFADSTELLREDRQR